MTGRDWRVGSVFVRGMGPEAEFELHPDGVGGAEQVAVVEVVLQPDLGELARQEGYFRGKARALATVRIARVEGAGIAAGVVRPKADVPAGHEAVDHLRVEAVIAEGF